MIGLGTMKRLHAAIVGDHSDRRCDACRSRRPREGGGYLLTMGGMRRKWICRTCLQAHARRSA